MINYTADAIPDEIKGVMNGLIEGRIKSLAIITEEVGPNGDLVRSQHFLGIDDHSSNVFTMLGAIESFKRDFLRLHFDSSSPYKPLEDDE